MKKKKKKQIKTKWMNELMFDVQKKMSQSNQGSLLESKTAWKSTIE
jgi:hypothetical protein